MPPILVYTKLIVPAESAAAPLLLLSQLATSRGEESVVECRIAPWALAELFDRHAQYLVEVLD